MMGRKSSRKKTESWSESFCCKMDLKLVVIDEKVTNSKFVPNQHDSSVTQNFRALIYNKSRENKY